MSGAMRVYVNGRGIDAPSGATALDAVRLAESVAADEIEAGESLVTDSRGLPLPADAVLCDGSILRVVANRRRPDAGDDE